jgi:hypothetical protein
MRILQIHTRSLVPHMAYWHKWGGDLGAPNEPREPCIAWELRCRILSNHVLGLSKQHSGNATIIMHHITAVRRWVNGVLFQAHPTAGIMMDDTMRHVKVHAHSIVENEMQCKEAFEAQNVIMNKMER